MGLEHLIGFFTGLLHGLNVAPIMNPNVTGRAAFRGAVSTFVLSGAFGALAAVIHNASRPAPAATPLGKSAEPPAEGE